MGRLERSARGGSIYYAGTGIMLSLVYLLAAVGLCWFAFWFGVTSLSIPHVSLTEPSHVGFLQLDPRSTTWGIITGALCVLIMVIIEGRQSEFAQLRTLIAVFVAAWGILGRLFVIALEFASSGQKCGNPGCWPEPVQSFMLLTPLFCGLIGYKLTASQRIKLPPVFLYLLPVVAFGLAYGLIKLVFHFVY